MIISGSDLLSVAGITIPILIVLDITDVSRPFHECYLDIFSLAFVPHFESDCITNIVLGDQIGKSRSAVAVVNLGAIHLQNDVIFHNASLVSRRARNNRQISHSLAAGYQVTIGVRQIILLLQAAVNRDIADAEIGR